METLESRGYHSTQSKEYNNKNVSNLGLPSHNQIFQTVSGSACSFQDYFEYSDARSSINDLVRSVNLHFCSSYCTQNGTKPCKSRFPFSVTDITRVAVLIDKNKNQTHRIFLRRNHPRVNQYSVPVLNFWRANMDLTILCGSPFASIVYVTYYTSKVDKSSNIRDVINKVRPYDSENDTKASLRKILLNMDTCRATGLPEAASNLLLYPHRYTSSRVMRLDTRSYLNMEMPLSSTEEEGEINRPNSILNELLHDTAKEIEDFDLPDVVKINTNTFQEGNLSNTADKIASSYYNSPEYLYNPVKQQKCSSEDICMTEYIENYVVTQKKKITEIYQTKDVQNKIVEPRKSTEQDYVLDLKYRVSPPDTSNPKWCAGALALYVPHRSLCDLLNCDGNKSSLTDAYKFYHSKMILNLDGSCSPLYPQLHKFEENETDLYNAISSQKIHMSDQKHLNNNSSGIDENQFEVDTDKPEETSDADPEHTHHLDLDPDNFPYFDRNAQTNLRKEGCCKAWDGTPQRKLLHAKNPWDTTQNDAVCAEHSNIMNPQISEDHLKFMSQIKEGQNPSSIEENLEVTETLAHANGNRKEAADMFLSYTRTECKSSHQRKSLDLITDVLEAYYYGHHKPKFSEESFKSTPIITMIGVPGAGKSWVVNKLRTWIDIRFDKNDLPCKSAEFATIQKLEQEIDSVTYKVSEMIQNSPAGKYGKSAAMAFSGSAAGIINGFTVHHALGFSINMNAQVRRGELPLPPLSASMQAKLLECWSSVKVLIIDEVFMLQVEWISLIDERLRQIFNSNIPFAGIPVIFVGDPRQIVPVNGKALYMISKYFNLSNSEVSLTEHGVKNLCTREEKGFRLYASSKFKAPLTTSIRLSDGKFAELNMKIATYQVNEMDLKEINNFCLPIKTLHSSPWIDAPWLFPTWNEVNEHLNFVVERASRSKGIFRAWCPVTVKTHTSQENAITALKTFYSSSTFVSAKFHCPLPYIDFFIGQIVCIKHNWNPKWKLFNNAKAFVVGIKCEHHSRQMQPLMTIDEAIQSTLHCPNDLKYSLLVKPFIPFRGPSAFQDIPGIIVIPWTQTIRKICGVKLLIEGPKLFPANAFSQHQSQGSTFERSIANINENSRAYGMANVVTSRTPLPQNFALSQPVTLQTLQPRPEVSKMVEQEYLRLSD